MTEKLSIPDAQAKRDAAFAAHENVQAEIKAAEHTIIANSPSVAVANGTSLTEAAKNQAAARENLAFLQEAKNHVWSSFLDTESALKLAHTHLKWSKKLAAAIQARIDAVAAREAAIAAKTQAENDYRDATKIIAEAHGDGMPKPAQIADYPLYLSATINQVPQIRMHPLAIEKVLWGVA